MRASELPPSLGPYLRLLWNLAPPLHAVTAAPDGEAVSPFLSQRGLHLPAAPPGLEADAARRWAQAAAAHAAAHLVFSPRLFVRAGVAPITQALIGLLEDARVEALACRALPGLRRLWAPLHGAGPAGGDGIETLLLRLARALVDRGVDDPHPWVQKGRALFHAAEAGEGLTPAGLRRMASALGHDLGQMRRAFDLRRYRPGPGYRDDNRWLWADPATGAAQASAPVEAPPPPPASEAAVWRHAEWDHRIGRLRPAWCTVHERRPEGPRADSPAPGAHDSAGHRAVVAALRQGRRRRGRAPQGDEIDLDAALHALLAARSGQAGDERVYRRTERVAQGVALFVLLDCSASSAEPSAAGALSRLALQQQAAAVLAGAAAALGWRVAVQGFCSDGRHAACQWRVQDFGEAWDAEVADRLARLSSGHSTRLGAALRHATQALAAEPAVRRVVLVLSDGDAHDVDIHDARYLPEDARHAVQSARRQGIASACLLLAPDGAAAARRMFGPGHSALLRDAAALPMALARVLATALH